MVDRNFIIRSRNGNDWDNLYPRTLNENVYNSQDDDLNTQLQNLKNELKPEMVVNGNGTATKFADGTMICRTKIDFEQDSATALSVVWDFPEEFLDDDIELSILPISVPAGYRDANNDIGSLYSDRVYMRYNRNDSTVGTNFPEGFTLQFMVIAIGRWK